MAPTSAYEEIPISTLLEQAKAGQIISIDVYGDDMLVTMKSGDTVRSRKEGDTTVLELLEDMGVKSGPGGIAVNIKSSSGLGDLSLRVYGKRQELVFLGREITEERDYSDKIAEVIDNHVDRLIRQAYARAKEVLLAHRDKLDRLAQYLIQHETVEETQLKKLLSDTPDAEPEAVVQQPLAEKQEPAKDARPQPSSPIMPPGPLKPKPAAPEA
jgi:hypothetical protein